MSIVTTNTATSTPSVRFERVRDFQPPWRTVAVYTCANGHETRLRVSHRGPAPRGAVRCSQCTELLPLAAMGRH